MILHYKKLSTTSSKLLTRKERLFWTKLRLFTIRDGKFYTNGKQVLHSEDANTTLLNVHQDKSQPNRVQLGRLNRGKYNVQKLRPICQRILTQCEKRQLRLEVRKTGPMFYINWLRVARKCMQLEIPLDRTIPRSRELQNK